VPIQCTTQNSLRKVAPEADPRQLPAGENLREALDIDSFDFLNLLIVCTTSSGWTYRSPITAAQRLSPIWSLA
jgi:hypothetical protein